jgi:hypothetical protein
LWAGRLPAALEVLAYKRRWKNNGWFANAPEQSISDQERKGKFKEPYSVVSMVRKFFWKRRE